MAAPLVLVGRTLSHYRILSEIGAGGMGVVYLARDERLDREVALKVLPPGTVDDESSRKRFRKESLALSKLNHPNIATIHEFDTADGIDFIVMEHIGGKSLDEMAAAGPLPDREVVLLGRELAEGLAAAHAAGVVHRDLKPGNVRLTREGRLKILDFGLAARYRPDVETARTRSETQTATEAEALAGTLAYMAPEQLSGRPADARSDLWAAGLVLYELATGRRAFSESSSTRLIASILQESPPAPRNVRRQISPGLETVILRCLEKDPARRYASAGDLEQDLARLAAGAHVAKRHARPGYFRWFAFAGVGLGALLGAALALNVGGIRNVLLGRAPIHSLAVLPLASFEGPEEDYFADGMTDQLIATLAQIGSLKVISRTSVMAFKNTKETLPSIARALHADAVVEGSVVRTGDRVRVTAELIRASTDEHLWTRTYERDLRDVLALQGDVARAIAGEIRVALTPGERKRLTETRTVDPEAYKAYLKGLYYWNRRTTDTIQKAIESFNQAIAIQPDYAQPYAGIAACYSVLPSYDPLQAEDAYPRARAAAHRAIELDSTLADPHAVLAGLESDYDWNQRDADRDFRRAIALNPSYATAHQWYGDYLACMGRADEAIAEGRRAMELDPLSPIIACELGGILARTGRYREAVEFMKKTIEMDPSFARSHQTLASVYNIGYDFPGAIDEYQIEDSLLQRRTPADRAAWFGSLREAYRRGGNMGYFRRLLSLRQERSKTLPMAALSLALAHAAVGENDSAFYWLAKAKEQHDPGLLRMNVEPVWTPRIRKDPRYGPFVRSLGQKAPG